MANNFEIVTINNDIHNLLKKQLLAVTFPLKNEIKTFIQDAKQYFIEKMTGPFGSPAGLAANQLGYPWKIIFVNVPTSAKKYRKYVYDTMPLTCLINPTYTPLSNSLIKDWEGCYSIPNTLGEVLRYEHIEFKGFNVFGEAIVNQARGFLARVIQHEIGHLEQQLFTDLISKECRCGPISEMLPIREREFQEYLLSF